MNDPISAKIRANPRFQELARQRTQMAWLLFGVTMTLFFGLILVVAFRPELLATPLGPGRATTIGWPIGAALIVFSWLLTAFYVRRANAETENTRQIIAEAVDMNSFIRKSAVGAAIALIPTTTFAADAISGGVKQPLNITAIVIFFIFVLATLAITYWAAKRSHSASDFYTAGGGITGFQNGLAVAGDYMSAATLLGITSLVYARGYDGFLYAIAFFMGWPILLFLMAERLRNLG